MADHKIASAARQTAAGIRMAAEVAENVTPGSDVRATAEAMAASWELFARYIESAG